MKKDHMKKRMFFVFALILALGFSALDLHGDAARASDAQSIYDSVFRLHVIANSDTEEDQAAKLAVRDAVLEYERTRMADVKDAAEARERLMEDGAGLLATVEQTLAQAACPMELRSRLAFSHFQSAFMGMPYILRAIMQRCAFLLAQVRDATGGA